MATYGSREEPLLSRYRQRFKVKVVRDLHWAVASPGLLCPSSYLSLVPADLLRRILSRSWGHLDELEREPAPLLAFLKKRLTKHRLGFYFAALVEYWLRHCQAVAVEQGLVPPPDTDTGGGGHVVVEQQVNPLSILYR